MERYQRKILKEAIKYPSQDDAEVLVDWYNNLNKIYIGSASPEIRKAFEKADQIRIDLHKKIFGDKSPWSTRLGRNREAEIYWDENKAMKLGL